MCAIAIDAKLFILALVTWVTKSTAQLAGFFASTSLRCVTESVAFVAAQWVWEVFSGADTLVKEFDLGWVARFSEC